MNINLQTKSNEKGQAMVEFAIVLPILLMLVLGIIQFGITFNHYLTLTDAVRAGARQAAVSRTASDPVGAAEKPGSAGRCRLPRRRGSSTSP